MRKRFLTGAALLLANQAVSAASWTFDDYSVALGQDQGGHYAVFIATGGSTNACVPMEAKGDIVSTSVKFTLIPPSADTACFSAFRPWEYALRLPDPAQGETYDVELYAGDEKIAEFSWTFEAGAEAAAAKAAADPGFAPSEGMWWSSDNPGTGLAFNMDDEGRWFGALYLYDDAGEPTFLTLQGESLAYNLDANALEGYAIGTSPVIRSEGGQCLGCPWTQATTSDTGDDAQLLFRDRNRATLSIGDWSLDLTLLPKTPENSPGKAAPLLNRHYSLTISGEIGQHVAVVKGVPGSGFVLTGQSRYALECVDCRTVDDDGAPSDAVDEALARLVNEEVDFLCTALDCSVTVSELAGRPYIDKTDTVITAVATDPNAPDAVPTRIELRLLPEGWRQ